MAAIAEFTKKPRAAIVAALGLEFSAVERHVTNTSEKEHGGTIYQVGSFRGRLGWDVAIVQAGMHNVPTAVETEHIIAYFKPSVVMLVGVAGGLKDVRLGDVVAATKIYAYEGGKDEVAFKPRPEIAQSSYGMVQRSYAVARSSQWTSRIAGGSAAILPKAFVGAMASGEKVVGSFSSTTYKLLRHHYGDALATEMEGYGFLHAAYMNGEVQAIVVRGISDMVEGKEESDKGGSQPRAADYAAAFAFEVLAQIDLGRQPHSIPEREWFSRLEAVASELYASGPNDRQVWSRAGGNLALLEVERTGAAAWHSALRTLENGGGGSEISPTSLLAIMLEEYPKNPALLDLLRNG